MLKIVLASALLGLCVASLHNVDRVNQNYNDKVNAKIVQQIQYELKASYLYQAYSHYFGRADVSLPGFAKWFEKASLEERQHATGLIEYINKRGGTVSLNDLGFNSMCTTIDQELAKISEFKRSDACICSFMSSKKDSLCAERSTWKNGLWAMQDTLVLERFVNTQLLELHKEAGKHEDPHLSHILEHDYLDEQVESIKKVADYIRQLERVGDGLGEYTFDKDLA
ncbi:yolk ferritin-like [Mercenaria mercenaria]|uniref:yolk ferritin-like n=1 Tax=Mercenaria mercenaria TaxID=6596 RepID=UPI00234F90D6|nr:yolk ferritin-like [Mercenaria mercenaria]